MVHLVEPKKSTLNDKSVEHVNREVGESADTPKAFRLI